MLAIGNDTYSKHSEKIVILTWRSSSVWSLHENDFELH